MKADELESYSGVLQELKQRRSLLSINEVAEILAMKPKTLYRMASKSRIPHLRFGYTIRFDPQVIHHWLDVERSFGKTRNHQSGAIRR